MTDFPCSILREMHHAKDSSLSPFEKRHSMLKSQGKLRECTITSCGHSSWRYLYDSGSIRNDSKYFHILLQPSIPLLAFSDMLFLGHRPTLLSETLEKLSLCARRSQIAQKWNLRSSSPIELSLRVAQQLFLRNALRSDAHNKCD